MSGPGRAHRQGISLIELAAMFPTETAAEQWFEEIHWQGQRSCGHCGSTNTYETKGRKPSPYRCRDCKHYFSVRIGTAMEATNLPLRKWAYATYLFVTSLKGVSSMKLHRDLEVTQKTAWFMLHRLRTAWEEAGLDKFTGPVEVDEMFVGGKAKNKHRVRGQKKWATGTADKTPVVGVKDRATKKVVAQPVPNTTRTTLHAFIGDTVAPGARVYTDENRAYRHMPFTHRTVQHGIGQYVKGPVHTNGIEGFWSMFKRGYHGTFHHMSPKHLHRYVTEFTGRHNVRDRDTLAQMQDVVVGMIGKRLLYQDLIS